MRYLTPHRLGGGTHPLLACPFCIRGGRPPEDASSVLSAKALFTPGLPAYAATASRGAWLSALLSSPSADSLCFACQTHSGSQPLDHMIALCMSTLKAEGAMCKDVQNCLACMYALRLFFMLHSP